MIYFFLIIVNRKDKFLCDEVISIIMKNIYWFWRLFYIFEGDFIIFVYLLYIVDVVDGKIFDVFNEWII